MQLRFSGSDPWVLPAEEHVQTFSDPIGQRIAAEMRIVASLSRSFRRFRRLGMVWRGRGGLFLTLDELRRAKDGLFALDGRRTDPLRRAGVAIERDVLVGSRQSGASSPARRSLYAVHPSAGEPMK